MGNFKTDVIDRDPRRASMDVIKDMQLLEPNFRRKILAIMADAKAHGVTLVVLETYRSQVRQAHLYNTGATKLKTVGCHGFGVAADLGIQGADGSIDWKADYSILGKLAAAHGCLWGGWWKKFPDFDHIQWVAVADQPKLFDGSWYPDADYVPG